MPYKPTSQSAQHALDEVQILAAQKQYSWIDGCSLDLSSATSGIETTTSEGTVIIDGETIPVGANTLAHQDGDPDNPRWDAICVVNRTGDLEVFEGVPAAPVTDDQGQPIRGESAFVPAPPDDVTPDVVCLGIVWIPPGATANGDLTDTSANGVAEPIVDRRVYQQGQVTQTTKREKIESSGWYRIAAVGSLAPGGAGGGHASGRINIRDVEEWSSTTLEAATQYGDASLTLLNTSSFTEPHGCIDAVRMVHGTTNEGVAVDVNVQLGSNSAVDWCEATIQNDYGVNEWSAIDWESASVPSGYETHVIDFTAADHAIATAPSNGQQFSVRRDGSIHATDVDRRQVGVRGYLSTEQTVPDATTETVAFDSVKFSNMGGFDTGTHEFTAPSDGYYHCQATMAWQPISSDNRMTGYIVTDNREAYHFTHSTVNGPVSVNVSDVLSLTAGNPVRFAIQQRSGSSQTLYGRPNQTFFSIMKLG